MVQTDADPIRMLTSRTDALQPAGSASLAVPLCILPGEPTEEELTEFAECMAETDCHDWTRLHDEDNGNTAMVCVDG